MAGLSLDGGVVPRRRGCPLILQDTSVLILHCVAYSKRQPQKLSVANMQVLLYYIVRCVGRGNHRSCQSPNCIVFCIQRGNHRSCQLPICKCIIVIMIIIIIIVTISVIVIINIVIMSSISISISIRISKSEALYYFVLLCF